LTRVTALRLVLASASPARLGLLRAAGLTPEVRVSGVDESGTTATAPADVVQELALRKAEAVAALPDVADALVIGCDSLLLFDGELFGKPADAAQARARWQRMRGREGTLLTGHALLHAPDGQRACGVTATTVRFGEPIDAELDAYIATGEPLRVAGGFTLDGYGAPFVRSIDGHSGTVIGLSLPLLRDLLRELDISIAELWAAP